ncbi:MAG: flagellar hook capping FlgD N-terminal domain-containing protein [Rickettsiales bacterium]|nr:flagellar hook capping FlgD N-terminal domain-containing protein [Rickettsiales bacterium]
MLDLSTLGFSEAASPATSTLRREDAELSSADQTRKSLAEDFDEFMLLFTTQLQNQDPTEPLDTNEMTAQLVSFTGVEQSVETNKLLEDLISLNSTSQADSAVAYIGQYVETSGNSGFLQDGQSAFSYNLPAGVQTASITVLDAAGRPVSTQTVEASEGSYSYNWDGVNSFDGTDMPNGTYSFGVAARDINGDLVDAETFTSGVVTSVALNGPKPVMTLNGALEVDVDKIASVVGRF